MLAKIIAEDVQVPEMTQTVQESPLLPAEPTDTIEYAKADDAGTQHSLPDFSRLMVKLALPIALQSLISAAVSSADVFMLAGVGQNALSAVSLAGQITFILTLIYYGLTTGVTILCAQYWGKGDTQTIDRVVGLSLRISIPISALFTMAALLFPSALMQLFTPEPALIALGVRYLRVIAVGYLLMGVSQMLLAAYKSMEQTKVSALISSACLFVNVALNAVSVFLLFPGNEAMAVIGVAAATAISRLIELTLCLLWSRKPGNARAVFKLVQHVEPWLKDDFWRYTRPVLLNYLVWGGALTATSAVTGHIGAAMVSASSIALSVRNLATVACTGFAGGGGILLGKLLGAKRLQAAKQDGRRLSLGSLLLGVVAGGLVLALRPLCLLIVPTEAETRTLLDAMLLVCAAYCVGKSFNSTLVGGIFCAGGDTRFGLICDAVAMWGVILPLGFVCAFVWHWPPIAVFMVLCMDEYVKMPFVAWHYRKHRWLNNLTRDTQ